MDPKDLLDPTRFPIAWYVTVLMMSAVAGLIRYYAIVKATKTPWDWVALLMEVVISGFVGVLTFWGYLVFISPEQITAAVFVAGIVAHFGTRALALAELFFSKYGSYHLGVDDPKNTGSAKKPDSQE